MEKNKDDVIISSEIAVGKEVFFIIRLVIAFICTDLIAVIFWVMIGYYVALIPSLFAWLILIYLVIHIVMLCRTHIEVTKQGVRGRDGHNAFDFTYDQIRAVNYLKKSKRLVIKSKIPEDAPKPDEVRTKFSLEPLKNGEEIYELIKGFLAEHNTDQATDAKDTVENEDEELE